MDENELKRLQERVITILTDQKVNVYEIRSQTLRNFIHQKRDYLRYNQDDKDFYQYLEFRLPNPPSILPFLWSCCFGRNEGKIHPPNEGGGGRNPLELIPLRKSPELNTDSQPNSDIVLKNL